MNYFIVKAGQQLGPFSEDQVRAMLHQGAIALQDLFWREGEPEWKPLAQWEGVFAPSGKQSGSGTTNSGMLVGFGYACAGIALLFLPIVFGIAGVAIGIVVQNRGVQQHGPIIIVASALSGILGFILGMVMWG